MSEPVSTKQDAKTIAIIAHITFIGLIIAFVMNGRDKSKLASFYIRQMLGFFILGIALSVVMTIIFKIIPFLSFISIFVWIGLLILWIMSLISSINEEEKEMPLVGSYFQDWFKSI